MTNTQTCSPKPKNCLRFLGIWKCCCATKIIFDVCVLTFFSSPFYSLAFHVKWQMTAAAMISACGCARVSSFALWILQYFPCHRQAKLNCSVSLSFFCLLFLLPPTKQPRHSQTLTHAQIASSAQCQFAHSKNVVNWDCIDAHRKHWNWNESQWDRWKQWAKLFCHNTKTTSDQLNL